MSAFQTPSERKARVVSLCCFHLSIYNGVIQGHVNRLHHVQRVFPCSYPSLLLTLSHSLPLLLCLLPSLSPSPLLPCSSSPLACFAASFPSLFAHLHSAKKWRCCSPPLLSPSFAISSSLSLCMWSSQWHGLFRHKNHWIILLHPFLCLLYFSVSVLTFVWFLQTFCGGLLRIKWLILGNRTAQNLEIGTTYLI